MKKIMIQTRGRTTKPKLWEVGVRGNEVRVTWGQEGGKTQETTQLFEAVNVGKANEKDPEMVALEWAERQILKKEREGYRDIEEEEGAEPVIDFNRPLPHMLRFYKPQNSMNTYMEKMCHSGKAWYVRKRNGEMAVAVKDRHGKVAFYSSKLLPSHKNEPDEPWGSRLPHLVRELEDVPLPNCSILLGELVAGPDTDDLQRVGSVMKSLTQRALELQENGNELYLCIWDVAFWEGEDLLNIATYRERRKLACEVIDRSYAELERSHLTVPEMVLGGPAVEGDDPLNFMRDRAASMGWEGWVVADPDSLYSRTYNFSGKAERPKQACKLKPLLEADFIVRWDPDNGVGEWGKGKKKGGVGSVFAYLWDEVSQEEVYISKVGGGLKDEHVFQLADQSLYPMVWEVEFASWTPKGSLQFPQFVRVRDDKEIEDCPLSQRPSLEDVDLEE